MSSMLTSSQGIVLATAMAVSAGTVFLFEHFRDRNFHQNPHPLKSCLCSESKKRKKKKKVQFAKDVKDSDGNGELYRKEFEQRMRRIGGEIDHHHHHHNQSSSSSSSCGKEVEKIPANRMALYNGMLKDRVQRMGCSY